MSTIFSKFSKSFQIQTESLHWPWGSPQSCPHDVAELIAFHSPLFIGFWQNWPLFSFWICQACSCLSILQRQLPLLWTSFLQIAIQITQSSLPVVCSNITFSAKPTLTTLLNTLHTNQHSTSCYQSTLLLLMYSRMSSCLCLLSVSPSRKKEDFYILFMDVFLVPLFSFIDISLVPRRVLTQYVVQ